MSGDWFEEAISELDDVDPEAKSDITLEELSEELGEELSEELSEEFDEKFDGPTENGVSGEQTQDTAVGTDESIPDETEQDSGDTTDAVDNADDTADTVDNADDTADTVDDADRTGDETGSDPFGFDSGGNEGADTQSSTEFDANTGNTDEFGFGSGDTADDPTPADDSTPADSTDQQSATQSGSSMAQSADEFGFSLDETDDSPTPASATETQPDVSSPDPTPTQSSSSEPADDQPEDDPFGFGTNSGGTAGGESTAMGGDDDFGFGGFGGGGGGGGAPSPSGPEEFDDDEFESNIDRIDLGIDGLDDMILGGVPERSLIGIIGGAGTGKTTFALQFLNQALKQGERAVFITLEQTEEAVLSTAEEKGWPFRQYVEDDMLAIVVLDPVEMANSLASIRGDISRLIREFGASRLVLDSVSLLEMMYDHPAKRRSEIFDFTRSLKEAGVTTLLTSEASEDSSHASRYGAVEYLTDAVFVLRYVRTSNFEETRLAIEIQKIRDANHSRSTKPYDLTDEGMSVHRQANIF